MARPACHKGGCLLGGSPSLETKAEDPRDPSVPAVATEKDAMSIEGAAAAVHEARAASKHLAPYIQDRKYRQKPSK